VIPPPRRQDWRALLLVFWLTSMVEGMGVSQIFAFLPEYLREMGVAEADRLPFVGLFSSLLFVVGAPLVPLWGVWADKYSRKAVVIRSALVEAVVFAAVALSREPWQLALSLLLVGFQLGNTGVMLAAIRDVAPRSRLGFAIGLFGASGPIGFAVGPLLGGWLIDGLHQSISSVFWVSAAASVGTALLVALGSREVRPEVIPEGRVLTLAYGAIRGAVGDPAVRRIFVIFGVSFLANQVARPYQPILVERIIPAGPGLASAIGLVVGVAALVGALLGPLTGALGDRLGFRRVLVVALAANSVALLLMPSTGALPVLVGLAVILGAGVTTVSSMVFGLLATEVPPERRSATLNLVYLPLYAAGIIGPAVGGAVASGGGVGAPFLVGAVVFAFGALVVGVSRASGRAGRVSVEVPAGPTETEPG
jgi:DHA1 family multidrug resistance protein-like MFS transporter